MLLYSMILDGIQDTTEEIPAIEQAPAINKNTVTETRGSSDNIPGLHSTDTTIPEIENLPEDTQIPITEAYRNREALVGVFEGYIQGTEKYKEQIPKIQNIITQNITPIEETTIEIPAEKGPYIKDTRNILKISNIIEKAINSDIPAEEWVRVAQAVKKYASKYHMEEITERLISIDNMKDLEAYYANNPKVIFLRARNKLQKVEPPELGLLPRKLQTIAGDFLYGYALRKKKVDYEQGINKIEKTFSTKTMTDKAFEDTVNNQTREINDLHMALRIEEECYKKIQKTNGIQLNYKPGNDIKPPQIHILGIFNEAVQRRLNNASFSLDNEVGKAREAIKEKSLYVSITDPTLDNIHKTLETLQRNYNENLREIYDTYLRGNLNTLSHGLRESQKGILFNIYSQEYREEKECELKEFLNSERLLFHGTNNLESRYLIAITGELQSRSKQQEIRGLGFFGTRINRKGKEADEKPISKEEDNGAESQCLCFADEYEGAYSDNGGKQFVIGIPESTAYRDYSIGCGLKDSETRILDRENPEKGASTNPENSFLFMGVDELNRLKNKYGEQIENQIKEIWGSHLVITNEEPPSHINLPKQEPIRNARLVDTNSWWIDKFGGRQRVLKVIYNF